MDRIRKMVLIPEDHLSEKRTQEQRMQQQKQNYQVIEQGKNNIDGSDDQQEVQEKTIQTPSNNLTRLDHECMIF